MAAFSNEQLSGDWVHSFEEDGPAEIVFRTSGYDFPRARGRRAFNLHQDGSMLELSPGRSDLPESSAGTWNIDGETVIMHHADGSGEQLRLKEVSPGKLVIRKI